SRSVHPYLPLGQPNRFRYPCDRCALDTRPKARPQKTVWPIRGPSTDMTSSSAQIYRPCHVDRDHHKRECRGDVRTLQLMSFQPYLSLSPVTESFRNYVCTHWVNDHSIYSEPSQSAEKCTAPT